MAIPRGTQGGELGRPRIFEVGDGPTSVTSGLFDRDRKPDLATTTFGDDGDESETRSPCC